MQVSPRSPAWEPEPHRGSRVPPPGAGLAAGAGGRAVPGERGSPEAGGERPFVFRAFRQGSSSRSDGLDMSCRRTGHVCCRRGTLGPVFLD